MWFNLVVLMILLFSGLRGLIEVVTIVLTRDIRDLKFDINIDLWLKSYLSHETDIWFIKLIFEPWNFNWHPIPELQILSDDWHLIFGNAFWLIWRALLVIESWLVFSLEASVSLECQFGSLTGLVPLKCIFAWLTAFFNYIWYNHNVWNFSFESDIQYLGYEIDIWFMIF